MSTHQQRAQTPARKQASHPRPPIPADRANAACLACCPPARTPPPAAQKRVVHCISRRSSTARSPCPPAAHRTLVAPQTLPTAARPPSARCPVRPRARHRPAHPCPAGLNRATHLTTHHAPHLTSRLTSSPTLPGLSFARPGQQPTGTCALSPSPHHLACPSVSRLARSGARYRPRTGWLRASR